MTRMRAHCSVKQGRDHACDNSVCWNPDFVLHGIPPPPCISYALVQATVGVGTVIIVYVILITYEM